MAEQRLELNGAEREHLDALLDFARAVVLHYGLPVADGELPTLAQLDRSFGAWAGEPVETRVRANDVVDAFGAVLGAHLCRELGLHWILVSDDHGNDFAVNGEPNYILMFPLDATVKRVSRAETRFFEEFAEAMVDQVRDMRSG